MAQINVVSCKQGPSNCGLWLESPLRSH